MNAMSSASPVPESSHVARPLHVLVSSPSAGSADTAVGSSYNDVRRSLILVEHDREQGALFALLRLEPTEHPSTRETLRRLGFHPSASPERWSIRWRRDVTSDDLRSACRSLSDAFGDEVALDVGASFVSLERKPVCVPELSTFWPGRFVLHVGGTHRCVVFGAHVDERELARAFEAEHDAYWANDYVPATE